MLASQYCTALAEGRTPSKDCRVLLPNYGKHGPVIFDNNNTRH
jgi:hypothetical protein